MGKATKTKTRPKLTAEEQASREIAHKAEAIGVPEAHIAKGGFVIHDVRLEEGDKVTTHTTLLNRGGSAIERWLHEPRSKLFHEPERNAVRYCQNLWQRIDQKGPMEARGESRFLWMGQSEHEALSELAQFKGKLPRKYWDVFEDICRYDRGASDAGSVMATNSRSANDAAKLATAFVAGMIAQWRRL